MRARRLAASAALATVAVASWSSAAGAASPLPGPRVTALAPRVVALQPRVVTLQPRVVSVAPTRSRTDGAAADNYVVTTDVLFAFDSAALSPTAQPVLASVVKDLKGKGKGTVKVVGYTDSIGATAYNLALSARRAAAVQAFLQAAVANPALAYRAQGLGEADPVAPNTLPNGADNPAGRAQNRRVTISYTPG